MFMEPLPTQQDFLLIEYIDSNEEVNFVRDSVATQSFSEYLADTDTDEDNSDLAPSRRYVWYCKLRTCPKYYTAWSCKTNFSSIYTRHQSTVTIPLQAHVIVDASFQGVGERRQLKTSVSLRKSRHKSITMDWQLRRALKRKLAVLQYGEEQVGWAIKEDKIEHPTQANCSRHFSLSY